MSEPLAARMAPRTLRSERWRSARRRGGPRRSAGGAVRGASGRAARGGRAARRGLLDCLIDFGGPSSGGDDRPQGPRVRVSAKDSAARGGPGPGPSSSYSSARPASETTHDRFYYQTRANAQNSGQDMDNLNVVEKRAFNDGRKNAVITTRRRDFLARGAVGEEPEAAAARPWSCPGAPTRPSSSSAGRTAAPAVGARVPPRGDGPGRGGAASSVARRLSSSGRYARRPRAAIGGD